MALRIMNSGDFWQMYVLLSQDVSGHVVCMKYAFGLLKILFKSLTQTAKTGDSETLCTRG